eukprot:c11360_g1_i1 orf=276-794(+)
MQGARDLSLLLVLLSLSAAACTCEPITWSHDPEWFNEQALQAASSLSMSQVKPLFSPHHAMQALLPLPIIPPHPVDEGGLPFNDSPEWFLMDDPEFFNENLLLPMDFEPPIKSRLLSRRLLKPHCIHHHNYLPQLYHGQEEGHHSIFLKGASQSLDWLATKVRSLRPWIKPS